MSLHDVGLAAGAVATGLFIVSYLPMLVKARKTRDLTSYSPSSLALVNIGNVVQALYVVTLPPGPLWALHSFYVGTSALMFGWWLRYARATARHAPERRRPRRSGP